MHRPHRLSILLTLVCSLAATPVLLAQSSTERAAPAAESLVYQFQAAQLDYPTGTIEARFEYRHQDRVLGIDRASLRFGGKTGLVMPLPSGFGALAPRADLEVWVFADDRLLEVFDLAGLRAYNRTLAYKRLDDGQPLVEVPRTPPTKIFCQSPCGGGCGPFDDYDCDGVNNMNDNCTDHANSNQADCDNDGYGDVCDATDGIFQASGPVDTCMTDKDDHIVYKTFEHHVEQRLVDVSSCGSPDRWNRWIRDDNDCVGLADKTCCEGLRTSIQAVGDSETYWCGNGVRNVDFCQ